MTVIYIMGLIGFIILIISWVNYLNLSIAEIYSRRKNLILYKIHESTRGIFYRYFFESLLIVSISFLLAYILISFFFPNLKTITGNVLNENMFQFDTGIYKWLIFIFAGSLSIGSIPTLAFIIKLKKSESLFKLTSFSTKKNPSSFFRKMLIVFQFTLTIILIISALVINSQSKYILDHQTGAKKDSVLVINLFNQDILSKFTLLKSELLKSPYIKDATTTFDEPYGLTMDAMGFETSGIKEENKDKILWIYATDDDYFKFNEVQIIAGSDFPPFNENLKREYYILNESAVKELGWTPEEAIGKPFKLKFVYAENVIFGGEIVGVVKDFNINTLHHEIKPFVFFQKEIWFWNLLVKIDMGHKNFVYKIELNWLFFVLAGIIAFGIALLTVSWQSWRAATRNPVEALRYE